MSKKKLFIVFEGVEGSGKSYQSRKLYKNLLKKGYSCILTREPGGTESAEKIRNLILKDYFRKSIKDKFHRYTDTLLYLASRNEHLQNKILPALKQKKIVICDRFTDSTIAYQVNGKKINLNFINLIHKFLLGSLKPDITFMLNVDMKIAMRRLNKRKVKNRYDKFPVSFYKKVQGAFLKISRNRKNYYVLNSSDYNNKLEKKILTIVLKKI